MSLRMRDGVHPQLLLQVEGQVRHQPLGAMRCISTSQCGRCSYATSSLSMFDQDTEDKKGFRKEEKEMKEPRNYTTLYSCTVPCVTTCSYCCSLLYHPHGLNKLLCFSLCSNEVYWVVLELSNHFAHSSFFPQFKLRRHRAFTFY